MKTTTLFPPMKVGKTQVLLPSGVVASKDGKYHLWQCSVSGLGTFAKPDYWVKVMAKYGSEANLVKTYVCKKAQKLLDEGMTQEAIIKVLGDKSGPKKERKVVKSDTPGLSERQKNRAIKAERKALTKRTRKAGLKSFAVGKVDVKVVTDTGSIEIQKVPVYPWQGDPNYFGSGGTSPLSVCDATKESCAFPNRYLDDECQNCPLYAECVFERKYTESDWKKGKKVVDVKVKEIKSFDV